MIDINDALNIIAQCKDKRITKTAYNDQIIWVKSYRENKKNIFYYMQLAVSYLSLIHI